MHLPRPVTFLITLLALALPVRGYEWQFERVDTAGNWSSPSLSLSGIGVLHFCYRAPGNRIVHSYLDSIWHHEEVGPFETLYAYAMDAGAYGEFGLMLILSGGLWLYEKQDTMWRQDSMPMPDNAYSPRFCYDSAGDPSVVFGLGLSVGGVVMYARRTSSTWVSETAYVADRYHTVQTRALTYTVKGEPCAMVYTYYQEMNEQEIDLLVEQADTWQAHSIVSDGRRANLSDVACAPDTGGGAAVLYYHQGEFPPSRFCYKGFGTGSEVLDVWASAGAVAVHSSGTPHVAYIAGQLRYACRTGMVWDLDTVFASPCLLGGVVLKDTVPIIGFIDPATGVWLARRLPAGIQEQPGNSVANCRALPTVVRRVLCLPPTPLATRTSLFDMAGRQLMTLCPGANDVRALAPGVYFVREEPQASSHKPQAIRKIVLTK